MASIDASPKSGGNCLYGLSNMTGYKLRNYTLEPLFETCREYPGLWLLLLIYQHDLLMLLDISNVYISKW